ncbi:MAG: M48 family metallopeptidase [Candidatus Spyradocola sp.]
MEYTIVRQQRKSVAIHVGEDGRVEVRAPLHCPAQEIARFVDANADWIAQRQQDMRLRGERAQHLPESLRVLGEDFPVGPSPDSYVHLYPAKKRALLPQNIPADQVRAAIVECYRKLAKSRLPDRVRTLAARFGLTYGRVTVKNMTGRWGSCSSQGNLNFSLYLMMASPAAIDSVIIHELMHRVQLNHSPEFRRLERENTPDLDACRRELDDLARSLRDEGWV